MSTDLKVRLGTWRELIDCNENITEVFQLPTELRNNHN